MTDEAKALVELMRDRVVYDSRHYIPDPLLSAGADLIETQAREIERLNALLSELNDTDVIARTMAERQLRSDRRRHVGIITYGEAIEQ